MINKVPHFRLLGSSGSFGMYIMQCFIHSSVLNLHLPRLFWKWLWQKSSLFYLPSWSPIYLTSSAKNAFFNCKKPLKIAKLTWLVFKYSCKNKGFMQLLLLFSLPKGKNYFNLYNYLKTLHLNKHLRTSYSFQINGSGLWPIRWLWLGLLCIFTVRFTLGSLKDSNTFPVPLDDFTLYTSFHFLAFSLVSESSCIFWLRCLNTQSIVLILKNLNY